MKYPKWLPYPSSWFNALLLLVLMALSSYIGQHLYGRILLRAAEFMQSPELAGTVISLTILSPILNIAFVHHGIHLLLSRFAPSLQAPEIGTVKGFMPTLFSWWEGLLGWTVMSVSLLVNLPLLGHLAYWRMQGNQDAFEVGAVFLTFTWLTCAAYLYHCFYLVEHRLMAAAKNERSNG